MPRTAPREDALQELDEWLAQVPEPLQPLDLPALDGFMAGVLLQPRRIPASHWLPFATDDEGRALPAAWPGRAPLQALIQQRYAELDQLVEQRQWFDPWITDVDHDTLPLDAVQPWVLGFATACGLYPELTEGRLQDHPEFNEALAQIYQHLDPQDLEDADELIAEIESLEPPQTLEEAVESLVRGCLLLADISRPRSTVGTHTSTGRAAAEPRPHGRTARPTAVRPSGSGQGPAQARGLGHGPKRNPNRGPNKR